MYDSHVNGLRGYYLTFAFVCVWLIIRTEHVEGQTRQMHQECKNGAET